MKRMKLWLMRQWSLAEFLKVSGYLFIIIGIISFVSHDFESQTSQEKKNLTTGRIPLPKRERQPEVCVL